MDTALGLGQAEYLLCFFVKALIFLVEEVPNFFHHRHRVGPLLGVLS